MPMKMSILVATLSISYACAAVASAQSRKAANPSATPPSVLRLVSQEATIARNSEKEKLRTAMSRACDRLEAPSSWIDLQSLSGSAETVLFEPFDSYQQWEQSLAEWSEFYIRHPDVARLQEEIDRISGGERKTFALRRDDVGYLADTIDLSEMHYMRVLEVRLFAGHEDEFVESLGALSDAYKKVQADTPWVVYEVDMGTNTPTFLIFFPLASLAQNDNLLSTRGALLDAQGGEAVEHAKQVARESYASTQSTLYAVRPALSHVPKEFAEGDQDFWRPPLAPGSKPSSRSNEVAPKN
jgi:hypothetical protein